ncbi:RHS repeat-associated core domain-containing protein [Lentzea sp. NPDC051213]|uniref:RHS repeat-associated core domain-containing protein n=1 Tax=Lentzea sp. NPDC051213 TaxID=3364126 RepID=UPI0037A4CA8B
MTALAAAAGAAPAGSGETALMRPDEAAARITARVTGKRVEVVNAREETSQTFANPDGTLTNEVSARPARVRRPDGSWVVADPGLEVGDDGVLAPRATTVGMRFSTGTGPLATISDGDRSVSVSWPHALPKPKIDGNTATYPEVLPGVDLRVLADVDGYSQVLVVKTRDAAKNPKLAALRFAVAQKGVTTKADEQGNLQAVDAQGTAVFTGAAPSMWDSSATAATEDRSVATRSKGPGTARKQAKMRTTVTKDALEVVPDAGVIADPATEFPLFIDPGFTSSKAGWTLIWNGNADQSYWNSADVAKVGTPNAGTYKMRSFFLMNTNGLQRKQILSATFTAQQLSATSCTPTPVELWATGGVGPGTTWNNSPFMQTLITTQNTAKGFSSACPAGAVSFPVTTALQTAVNGNASVFYLGLKAQNETLTPQWKTFANNPTMSVTYNTIPSQPNYFSINPCYTACGVHPSPIGDARPTFKARSVDPDAGQKLRLDFEVLSGSTVVQRGSTGWGTTGQILSWRANAGLTAGATYGVHVRAFDGTSYGPWSSAPTFVIDTAKPANAVVSSTDYPAGQWSKSGGEAGTFTFTAPSADLGGFAYGLDQPVPTGDVKSANGSASVSLSPAEGPHTLYVRAKDKAGNASAVVTEYKFSVGKGAVTNPSPGDVTAGGTGVELSAPTDITGVTPQWRRGDADTWTDIPAGDVSRAEGGGTVTWPVARSGADFPKLNWDLAKTLNNAEEGDEPLDGPTQFRAAFSGGQGGFSGPVRFTLDRDLGSAADEGVGPGSVNLVTGNLSLSNTDVSAKAYGSDLTVSRSFATRDAGRSDGTGMFGAGWTSGITVEDVGGVYTGLTATGSLVQVATVDAGTIGFTKNANGSYTPEPGAEDLKLTYQASSSTYALADDEGTVVTFAKSTGSAVFRPASVTTPGNDQATTYAWETVVVNGKQVTRPTRVLAPVPAGVTCTALVRGCRALTIQYAGAGTTLPGEGATGDYPNRVRSVSFTAWDPDATPPAMRTIELARYAYDRDGRLREAWEPRLDRTENGVVKHFGVAYQYNGDGIVSEIRPGGQEPWQLSYTTVPGDSGTGRLAQVSRSALAAGTARTTVVYRVPASGNGAPYDLSDGQTRRWAQNEAPVGATAVFPASQVPDGNQATGTLPSGWGHASVIYFDANGRAVNNAEPGGAIDATEYDRFGNTVRTLTASNRVRALDSGDSDDAATEAGLARALSTVDVASADGSTALETFGPEQEIALRDGSHVTGRAHTRFTYDEGAPASAEPFGLVTTQIESVRLTDGTDTDARTTKTTYDWTLRAPLTVTEDAGGLNLTTRTGYDPATGLVVATTTPGGGSADNTPSTRTTAYYSAGAHATFAECGNRPEWANLPCRTGHGGQPAAGQPLLATVMTYDIHHRARTAVEKNPAGAVQRTRTVNYDSAGRPETVTVTGASGEPVPVTKFVYDKDSGNPVETQSLAADGSVTARIKRTFDQLGRLTSYTDADGVVATATYDLLSRPATTDDGKGNRTNTYDARGLLTKVVDSQAGTFTAAYDPDGELVKQTLPNGIEALTSVDAGGTPTGLTYLKPGCGQDDCTLLSDVAVRTVHGQVAERDSSLSAQDYTYDGAGRLTSVQDEVEGQCTTRQYAFSAATNRTGLSSFAPGDEGACQATSGASTKNWTYDAADRVTTAGYVHDVLGRATTVPAADTDSPAAGDLTATYHVSDLVRSLSQGGQTTTYTLDVNPRRVRSWTGGTGTVRRHHYSGDTDNPSWTDEGGGLHTRNIAGIDGTLGAVYRSEVAQAVFQLANLHGDVVATAAANMTAEPGLLSTQDYTEYGVEREQNGQRYGWLGGHQRASDTPGGVSLMGVRLYNPATARFLQVDPVYGGNANDYEYCAGDGVNCTDLSGEANDFSCWRNYRYYKKTWLYRQWKSKITCKLTHRLVERISRSVAFMGAVAGFVSTVLTAGLGIILAATVTLVFAAIAFKIDDSYKWNCSRQKGVYIYYWSTIRRWRSGIWTNVSWGRFGCV